MRFRSRRCSSGAVEAARLQHPAIYISNHTSMFDIFIGIWLAPIGTVGVAKKQVVYYPFFGLLYAISGMAGSCPSRRDLPTSRWPRDCRSSRWW